jgi:hypothetical protein
MLVQNIFENMNHCKVGQLTKELKRILSRWIEWLEGGQRGPNMWIFNILSTHKIRGLLTHTIESMNKNWAIYGQISLEVTSKSCGDSQIVSNFHGFWSEELYCEK